QPDVANQDQKEDAPHQMVDVQRADGDVVHRSGAGAYQVGDEADDGEGDEEARRGQEQPLPPLVAKVQPVEVLDERGHQPARDLRRREVREISSSMTVKSARGSAWMCPWKASVQCSGGHLRT